MATIKTECGDCGGTGLYSGFMEAKGEAVVCVGCRGSGCKEISYRPFERRKGRRGISRVRVGSGLILDDPRRAEWMSYGEFHQKFQAGVP